jgi:predicted glycogen debranching enzyme
VNNLVRALTFTEADTADPELMLGREWLVTNGLGGFASGTVAGVPTRRYHGLLVSALSAPLGRSVMLNHLAEWLRLPDGMRSEIGGRGRGRGTLEWPGGQRMKEFRLENGLPVWHYELRGVLFEKRVLMPHRQNSVHVTYRLLSGADAVRLKLRPVLHFRPLEGSVHDPIGDPYTITAVEDRLEVSTARAYPPLRLKLYGQRATFALDGRTIPDVHYRAEAQRGYADVGELWSPGYFSVDVTAQTSATLVASTERWDVIGALLPEQAQAAEHERRARLLAAAAPAARAGVGAELVLAADQFVITPTGRQEDAARARAAGEEVRSVIAGYHWFTDWGRDTMISLEGLTCTTGRFAEARWILRTFGQYVRDGLIPNMFPDGSNEGLYHTADASLWLFHAVDRYLRETHDRVTLEALLPKLSEIATRHLEGTRFGIHVDPKDGLLVQGADGYQLTWMDAKCDGWVVTPRRGKAVEINALWYNALRLLEGWTRDLAGEAAACLLGEHAEQCRRSFNGRFWYGEGGYLYDVVESSEMAGKDDPACRPNQLLAISLTHPVLEPSRWESVVNVARAKLLTPLGLRSLAPDHPDFKPTYHGDLMTRDAAYHQGTVWAWLIGPFIDAWLKVYPGDRAGARRFLAGFLPHLDEACIGSISEIFDAVEPFTPRGCIAQAWSVAEVLRCWAMTADAGPALREE